MVAASAVTLALRRAPRELDERAAPLAGLTAAYVFAAQMLNFPVGAGTSGHLLGGALAAALVGPHTATLVITVVLVVQALLFGDGGVTALGTNVVLMALVGVWTSWLVVRVTQAALPRRPASVVSAVSVGAFLSVPAAALTFTVLYGIGGTAFVPLGMLAATMTGWHTLIGIGEAVITGLTLAAVLAVRPDLVYAARRLRQPLQIRTSIGIAPVPHAEPRSPRPVTGFVFASLVVALTLAGAAGLFASDRPDGLQHAARVGGFLDQARAHLSADLPLADYGAVAGVPVGVAGVFGVVVTVGLGYLVFRRVLRRASTRSRSPQRV